MDNRRIAAWSYRAGEELSGRFMKIMALHDNHGNITAHALVEMNGGRIAIIDLGATDFRFIKEADDASSQ